MQDHAVSLQSLSLLSVACRDAVNSNEICALLGLPCNPLVVDEPAISVCRESLLAMEQASPSDSDGPLRLMHNNQSSRAKRFVCCSDNLVKVDGKKRFRSPWSNAVQTVLPPGTSTEALCLADQKLCGVVSGDLRTVHAERLHAIELELNRALEGYVDAYYGCCTPAACGSAFVDVQSAVPNRLVVHVVILSSAASAGHETQPSLFEDDISDRPVESLWCSRHTFSLDLREKCHVLHKAHLRVVNESLHANFEESRAETVPLSAVVAPHATGGAVSLSLAAPSLVVELVGQAVQAMENDVMLPRLTQISSGALCRLGPRALPVAVLTGSVK